MKNRIVTGIRPRSQITLSQNTPHFRVKMHELAGSTTVSYTGRDSNGTELSGGINVAGTTTSIFSNFGEFTSAGDNGTLLPSGLHSLFQDLFRTDTLVGTVLVLFNCSRGTTTSDGAFFSLGYLFSPNGIGIKYLTGPGYVQLVYSDGANGINVFPTTSLDTSNTDLPVAFLIHSDGQTITVSAAVSGVVEKTKTTTTTIDGSESGSALFGASNAAGTLSNNMLNSGVRMRDLLILRSKDDLRPDFAKLATAYKNSNGDLPWEFNGL